MFVFDPPPTSLTGHWRFNEPDGSTAADDSAHARTMTLYGGGTRTAGQSGRGNALRLDGVSGFGSTASPTVRTDQSFTVSAWVRLTRMDGYYTAVSQDGNRASGFYLTYTKYLDCWAFGVTSADADQPKVIYAASQTPPTLGVWTHLAGVYNAPARQIQLLVNGVPAGTASATLWSADGPLTVGRSRYDGMPGDYWPGDIDDVRTYSGPLTTEEIQVQSRTAP